MQETPDSADAPGPDADPPPGEAAEPSRDDQVRSTFRWAPVAVGLSVLAIAAIAVWQQAQTGEVLLDSFDEMDARWLPVAMGLHLMMHATWSVRFQVLAGGLGAPLRWPTAWRYVTAGQFGSAVTPGRFGAEALKIALLVRGGTDGARASRVVVADRSSDLVFFILSGTAAAATLTLLFGGTAAVLQTLAIVAVAGLVVFTLLLVWGLAYPRPLAVASAAVANAARRAVRRPALILAPRIQDFLARVRDGLVDLVRRGPLRVTMAAVLTLVVWSASFGALWAVLHAFGHDVPWHAVFAAGVLLTMLAPLPVSPGGAGIVEFAALVLLSPLAPGMSVAVVLVWRGLTYYYDIAVGGLVAAWSLGRRR